MPLPPNLQGAIMGRIALAAVAIVLGCSAALAEDLSTNFKVRPLLRCIGLRLLMRSFLRRP